MRIIVRIDSKAIINPKTRRINKGQRVDILIKNFNPRNDSQLIRITNIIQDILIGTDDGEKRS